MRFFVPFVFIALIGGVDFYLAHHLWRCINYFVPKFSIAIPLIFVAVMTVMMFLSFLKPLDGVPQRIASVAGACWMGIFVYLLIFFLLSDLVVLVLKLLPILSASAMPKVRLAADMGALILALTVSIYGFCNAQRISLTQYDIDLSEEPTSEMNVVLISDVHLGAIGSEARLEKIVAKINELEPDLVCIAGDFFDTDFRSVSDPEKAIETMRKISSRYGVYACLGNHDSGKTLRDMENFFERANIKLLKDEYVIIDDRLILAGRLDPSPIYGAGDLRRGELSDVLDGAASDLPVVMLDHNPVNIDTYRADDVNLVLSGHTHKGQIFPGGLVTNALFTVDYGYYRAPDGMQAVVTSGAGAWGPPMRVGTNCEVVKINLKFT